jgi:hypothetical protein
MLQSIPDFTQISPLTAAAFCDLPYSPALLLDGLFSAVITDDAEFHQACESGFNAYFEEMYELDEMLHESFVARRYNWADLAGFVSETVWSIHLHDWRRGVSAAWGAGFGLGWLSAHALLDRPASEMALEVLRALIEPPSYPLR